MGSRLPKIVGSLIRDGVECGRELSVTGKGGGGSLGIKCDKVGDRRSSVSNSLCWLISVFLDTVVYKFDLVLTTVTDDLFRGSEYILSAFVR